MQDIFHDINSWIDDHQKELLDNFKKLIRIPSVRSDPIPNAPFGKPIRESLDFMLDLSQKSKMRIKDLEGYIGYAEFGQGDKLIASIGHLDVVPAGNGWNYPPFGSEIHNDYIYSRGVVDDKGPTMASFYAARAIQECVPDLKARFRLIFGCNEESGFQCIKHYVKQEEIPTYGIVPDSDWPVVFAEKGKTVLEIHAPLIKGELELLKITGGSSANAVMDLCETKLKISSDILEIVKEKLTHYWDKNIEWKWENNILEAVAKGKSAHGSDPYRGDSAYAKMLRFLCEIAPSSNKHDFEQLLDISHLGGSGLGISCQDDISAGLSSNLSIVDTKDNKIIMTIDIRYPATLDWSELEKICRLHVAKNYKNYEIASTFYNPPLNFPQNHPLVQTIVDVYEKETGLKLKAKSSKGATYARAIPNSVSIGTGWEGDGNIHSFDECLKVEHLYKMCKIYAHVLYELYILK